MKYVLLLILLVAAYDAHTQSPKSINATNIPGTKVFMQIPQGFRLDKKEPALRFDSATIINVGEEDNGNHYTDVAYFSELARKRGETADYTLKDTTVGGYDAKYNCTERKPGTREFFVLFGDSTFDVALFGRYPAANEQMGEVIKKCMLNARYDRHVKPNHLAYLPFTLDDTHSDFKYDNSEEGMIFYSRGGGFTIADAVVMVIYSTADSSMSLKEQDEQAAGIYTQSGYTEAGPHKCSSASVNGYNAYSSEFYMTKDGERDLSYNLVVSNGKETVSIRCIARSDFDKNLAAFKQLAGTIRFK